MTHKHHCAAIPEIHPPGRETPAIGHKPEACECEHPETPQCCATHPTAQPGYRKPQTFGLNQLQGFAEEIRLLKAASEEARADIRDLKQLVAALSEQRR